MTLRLYPRCRAHTLFAASSLAACLADAGPTLTAPEASEQAHTGTITLIDIRTPEEWRQTGVAVGTMRIDMHSPQGADVSLRPCSRKLGGATHPSR